MNMQIIGELLENEFKHAFEVRDEESLHRGVSILVESIPQKEQNKIEHDQFKEALLKMDAKTDVILNKMDENFRRMDQRFESLQKQMDERFAASDKRFDDVNKRFEDMNKRFDDMSRKSDLQIRFITLGFVMLTALMSVYQFLQ